MYLSVLPHLDYIRQARSMSPTARPDTFRARADRVEEILTDPDSNPVVSIQTIFGVDMEVDLREEVSRSLYVFGSFEDELVSFFCRTINPGAVFVDIGAHYGLFSTLAAMLVGADGQVISFEPTPDTVARLERNLQPFPWASVNAAAVWDVDTTLTFNTFDVSWSAFNSYTSIRAPTDFDTPEPVAIEVPAVSLDSYFAGRARGPDYIKIDAESAELKVLIGAQGVIDTHRPIVTIEVGDYPHLVESGVATSRETLSWIRERGYTLFEPGMSQEKPHRLRKKYGYQNILCVPSEKAAELTK